MNAVSFLNVHGVIQKTKSSINTGSTKRTTVYFFQPIASPHQRGFLKLFQKTQSQDSPGNNRDPKPLKGGYNSQQKAPDKAKQGPGVVIPELSVQHLSNYANL